MTNSPRIDRPAAIQLYIDIIDKLVSAIKEGAPAPQWGWFQENALPLAGSLLDLRGRLLQEPPTIIAATDVPMMLMLRWYSKVLLELASDLERYQGLKPPG